MTPKKISTKSSYPPKIFIFLKTPKNIEIQNFEPQKTVRTYVCVKISEYSPSLWATTWIFSTFADSEIKAIAYTWVVYLLILV